MFLHHSEEEIAKKTISLDTSICGILNMLVSQDRAEHTLSLSALHRAWLISSRGFVLHLFLFERRLRRRRRRHLNLVVGRGLSLSLSLSAVSLRRRRGNWNEFLLKSDGLTRSKKLAAAPLEPQLSSSLPSRIWMEEGEREQCAGQHEMMATGVARTRFL